ncbi:SDR family oxidoreductase [Aquincola sp. MAHUQ-54]|uniref:SDR family oxidoreductase n=1 Tax=Aquincola agrisoli TaxID=3119538 RepID=A0AAW9Q6U4_9BURK
MDTQAAGTAPLSGKVVIVTGGSRGLGAAIAEVLGRDGARVVIGDLSLDRAQERALQLRAHGIDCEAHLVDVGDDEQVQALMEHVDATFGGIDIVVNNAAVDVPLPLHELSVSDWDRVLRTNLCGPFLVAKHVLRVMAREGRGGHIVNVLSTASKRAWPNASAYQATQWGLLGLSHALHAELRPQGIKVCAVLAGGMRTPFALDRVAQADPDGLQDPLHVARAVRFVLLQPEGTVVPEIMVLPMGETSWP